MSNRTRFVAAATASVVASLIVPAAHAATDTFVPTTPLSGTYAPGSSFPQNVTYYQWAVGPTAAATNFDNGYAVGDDVVFNQATGTYVLSPVVTLNPNSLSFTGGATYDFTRSSTTANANVFNGYGPITNGSTTYGGVDTFTSSAFTNADLGSTTGTFSLTLGTAGNPNSFTGKVILRSRPAGTSAIPQSSISEVINSGTLEIHDAAALPAATPNSPSLTLNGGTFAVNIDTGSYTYRVNNIAPSTGTLGGTLTVSSSSAVAVNAVDVYGRSRDSAVWQGAISIAAGSTLTVNAGGGTSFGGASNSSLTGTGTILIGTDAATANANGSAGANRLRLNGVANAGSTTLNFNLGSNGIIENNANLNGTTSFGTLAGQANTLVRGSTNGTSATASASTLSVGAQANSSSTFAGSIINGSASTANAAYSTASTVTGTNAPNAIVPVLGRGIANSNFTKAGIAATPSTVTLTGQNLYGGTTNVNSGTLIAQSNHALGDSSGLVTVASGATLDVQTTPGAGKQYVLAGGSLVNNGGSAVTLGTGVSANFTNNTTTGGGTGSFAGAGNTATVAFSAPNAAGGTQATGQLLLQLGSLSGTTGGAATGSGYQSEPILTFSQPDLSIAGARQAKATAYIGTSGQVAGVTIIDPGYGYTSVPTVTISGGGGTGFVPVFTMTASGIRVTNAGSGYTAAPTVTIGGTGYEATTATTASGFGNVNLTANSNVGGSGALTIAAPITGTGFGLTKVGAGTTTLTGADTYTGGTTVSAGTLATGATGNFGTGTVTVSAGTLQLGNAASIDDAATLSFAAASLVQLNALAGTSETLAAITNLTSGVTLTTSGIYTAAQLNSFFGVSAFSSLAGETVTIGNAVPEPASLAVLSLAGIGMLSRRRRQA